MIECKDCKYMEEHKFYTKWGMKTEQLCTRRPIESEEFESIVGRDYYTTDVTHRDCINNTREN